MENVANVYEERGRVRVDAESVLARLADWHAHVKGRPVAALGPETREATLFVADEVIIDGHDRALADELKRRYGAEVVPEAPLPARPADFPGERRIDLDAMPQPMRLRFAAPPRVGDVGRLLASIALRHSPHREIVVSSEIGAAVAAVVARHALEGRPIGLNVFGDTLAMPLTTAADGAIPAIGSNPFAWAAFAGRTRMVPAWQLVDSIRQVRGTRFTTIAILDSGFWLDNRGVPVVPGGQPVSDLGASFMQLNLQNEGQPAGGMSSGGGGPWHGNATASAAAASVNNNTGAAGSGGTVAMPIFLQTDISLNQILRAVRLCTAWGIDVLSMSIGTWGRSELEFPTTVWDKTFQFAFDNGVVMIAAAGNSLLDLPDADDHVRPATRTPGVLTVGALDGNDNAWVGANGNGSNFGSSVWLWAPGTNIPVAPDPANLLGSQKTGTSFAAPIVAGVAAMMRFANDRLTADDIRRLLIETGWTGTGRVGRGLDAYAAVLAAIRQTLPDTDEPNNTPARAAALLPIGTTGAIGPLPSGFSARSSAIDPDFWKFSVDDFSTVTVAVDWYENLGSLFVAVEAEDGDARGVDEMASTGGPNTGRFVLSGLLPPGGYRVRIGGNGVTAYRLLVTRAPARLSGDMFEPNDSFADTPRLLFESSFWTTTGLRTFGPGTFDATLHQERGVSVDGSPGPLLMNDDYFRLVVPLSGANVLRRAAVSVHDADRPVDVTLYDAAEEEIDAWHNVRNVRIFPPENTTCFLKVAAAQPTRYQISTKMRADPSTVPGPIEEELELVPKWWGDPSPLVLKDRITHYVLDVNQHRGDGDGIAFQIPDEAVRLELIDHDGGSVRDAHAIDGKLIIDTAGLAAGPYVLRVSKQAETPRAVVELRTAPPLLR